MQAQLCSHLSYYTFLLLCLLILPIHLRNRPYILLRKRRRVRLMIPQLPLPQPLDPHNPGEFSPLAAPHQEQAAYGKRWYKGPVSRHLHHALKNGSLRWQSTTKINQPTCQEIENKRLYCRTGMTKVSRGPHPQRALRGAGNCINKHQLTRMLRRPN